MLIKNISLNQQIDIARKTVQFELESLLTRPEQEPLLMDMIHAVSIFKYTNFNPSKKPLFLGCVQK